MKALILNFSKIKSEDEFVLIDEIEMFSSADFCMQNDIRAPSEESASLLIEVGNQKFT